MSDLVSSRDITKSELSRGRRLKFVGISAPIVLTAVPFILFFLITILLSSSPAFAISSLFVGFVLSVIGLIVGLGISAFTFYRHQEWSRQMRERIAAGGIGADEIDWFRKELKPSEKRALKALKAADPLIEDAYRETLASRLTATRIVKSSRKELQSVKRREQKLKSLKPENAKRFLEELKADNEKVGSIHNEAKQMLAEAESRLEMIEAAAARGGSLADTEVALKKLAARASQLPLALEAARIHGEAIVELEESSPDLLLETGAEEIESESNRDSRPERMN
jgi:ABC-type multidrug transport system fused ATPase/permease subunit